MTGVCRVNFSLGNAKRIALGESHEASPIGQGDSAINSMFRTERAKRQEIMAMLRAEHHRNQELHDPIMELSEPAIQHANGGKPGENTENDRGE